MDLELDIELTIDTPDSKLHRANMGPTWVLPAPGGTHVGPVNLAIWDSKAVPHLQALGCLLWVFFLVCTITLVTHNMFTVIHYALLFGYDKISRYIIGK